MHLKIAVLSGKGGTGKTTVSSNLATLFADITLVDCDVEEPNAHLFFDTQEMQALPVCVEYPVVNMAKCTLCGDSGDFCHFNAILPAKNSVLVFKESCHSCGGCALVCPENAISDMQTPKTYRLHCTVIWELKMHKVNEVVVISGKGGTGKTSVVASAIPFIEDLVIADCDVDAPDLNILFGETVKESTPFIGTQKAYIDPDLCTECGDCIEHCKFDAISDDFIVDNFKCEGCGVCEFVCLCDAVTMQDTTVGHILVSDTPYGEMVHGKLIPGEETSGKLVSQVRKIAKERAQEQGLSNIIIDGSPGIACNVISSITGAKRVVIVIEPTMSGLHDLERVYKLTQRFKANVSVIINKWDLCADTTLKIEDYCAQEHISIDLKIPFNKVMVEAISNREIPSIYARELFSDLGFEQVVKSWFETPIIG